MLRVITKKVLPQFFSSFYHINVIDHYMNPRNVGSLDKNDKNEVD